MVTSGCLSEHIIVTCMYIQVADDGSGDGTVILLVRTYKEAKRVKVQWRREYVWHSDNRSNIKESWGGKVVGSNGRKSKHGHSLHPSSDELLRFFRLYSTLVCSFLIPCHLLWDKRLNTHLLMQFVSKWCIRVNRYTIMYLRWDD